MKRFKLTIAGGGSTFTPGIVKGLLMKKEDFPLEELRLYDNNKDRQNKVGIVVKEIVKNFSPDLKVVVTEDPQKAFEGVDFVFAQIRVGLYKMRELDEKIPLKYGVVGQETCGLGGLAYGLRTIYPMVELVDYVEKYANQNHWVINYSNPASIVSEALKRLRPKARILNICDMPVAIEKKMCEILNCSPKELKVDYFGLNHFGWFTKVYVNSVDQTQVLKDYVKKYGYNSQGSQQEIQHSDMSWIETFDNAKHLVNLFPDYLPNTYMQYYLLGDNIVAHSDINRTRANEVMEGREKLLFDTVEKYLKKESVDLSALPIGVHGEFIVDVAMSLAYDLRKRYLVIVENKGAISNLSNDAMVEVPAYLTSQGPEPIRIGEIPTFYKGLLEQQLASEKLIVDAAIEHSYEKALQGFAMSKTAPSALVAKKILDEMLKVNKPYWPQLK